MLARGLSFWSFFFGCNNYTYQPSSIWLFIILIVFFFFPARGLGIGFVLSLGVTTPLIMSVILSKEAWHFSFIFGCYIPTYYPSYLIESFSKGAWHCFCLVFGCNNPAYYPTYFKQGGLTFLSCLWVWHPHLLHEVPDWFFFVHTFWFLIFLFVYIFFFLFFLLLFLLVSFLGKLVLITPGIVCPCPLVSSRFTVWFSVFNGNKLPLMTLVDFCGGGLAYFQSNCQPCRRDRNCSCF